MQCPIHDEGPLVQLKLRKATDLAEKLEAALKKATADLRTEAALSPQDPQKMLSLGQKEDTSRRRYADVLATLRDLRNQYNLYQRHCEQYSKCRAVLKRIEENLKPGQAVVYRDFVAQYMSGGGKLSNLVFVVLWHDSTTETKKFTRIIKFSHMCDDSNTRS